MHGIVVAGTTGEWFCLSTTERQTLMEAAGRQLKGRLTLIAECNAFAATQVIANAELAERSGFDGILVMPPPYIVPGDEEMFEFYRAVSAGVSLPICVYNWPPGTNVDMSCERLERVADLDREVAVKKFYRASRSFHPIVLKYPDRPEDVKLAVQCLFKHIAEYGGGPDQLYVGGHSAGAILAVEIAVDRAWMKDAKIQKHAFEPWPPSAHPTTYEHGGAMGRATCTLRLRNYRKRRGRFCTSFTRYRLQ
jgi:dihydrodipicolinate synthase/N-acetylneuraminate lyase